MQEVAAISAGFGHSLFLRKDGSAWATGRNDQGQLGDGTTTNRTKPVQVMTDVAAISAGGNHSLFLKKDGTVWASGQNDDGRLGDGTKTNQRKPVPVLTKVTAISAGDVHSLFLKNDGSAWGTGDNRFGQLGDALWDLYPADRHVISPFQVIAGVSSVCAGDSYSLFLMRDGSVRASGHNMFNNLGFKGPSTSKPTKISFRRRTPSEIKEAEKARDEIPVDSEKHLPILTKPPRTAFGATGVQVADHPAQIAVSVLDEEHGGIYVVNADGSGKQRLTTGSSDILPRWSPDGKQIAFLALREQDHELATENDLAFHWFLYVMDADGQHQRRVTKTPIGMIFHWSPDGTRFVFQSSYEDVKNKAKDGTASSAIYVMKSDGTQQKRLTPVENNDGFPSWSPDGKQIAFCSNRNGNMDIFVMNADGSDARRLTSHEANDIVPTWSPNGKQIAFTSSRESGTACVVNADGAQESSLAVRGRPVAWSPDGQSLLIENDGQLVLSGADGRNQNELTKAGEPALDGEYSPDGKAVFYRSKVNGTWTLMSVDTERSNQKRIWSDSGKFLGFSVSPRRVSLATNSIRLTTSNMHLTEFGNTCRKSQKLYHDSRKQLFALIPNFLDWKRREVDIPYRSTPNAFEVRVIFTPPDGTEAHVAVLISGNRHLVESKNLDASKGKRAIEWKVRQDPTEAERGRFDGHILNQVALVLEAELEDKASVVKYLESFEVNRITECVSSRIKSLAPSDAKENDVRDGDGNKADRNEQVATPSKASETHPTRFVPADTYAAMSINWGRILEKVDFDEPLLTQLRQLDHIDQLYFEDSKPERIIMLFLSQIDEKTRVASPAGTLLQFDAPLEPRAFFDRMHDSKYFETVQEEYKGQQTHVRRWSSGIHKGTESRGIWFFSDKNVVAKGSRHVVRQMIDGEPVKSVGKELVNDLDPKAELHFVLENNGNIDAGMLASVFGHFDPLPDRIVAQALRDAKRVEVLLNYAERMPINVTIEMKDDESTDRLMELIKGVLAEAPGILDAIEEHEIPREAEIQPPFRELIALGRTAVKEMKVERDGTTIRMTLNQVQGLEKLPQAYLTWSMIQAAVAGP
jgi:Tol biopolymer transport system component